jgi:hypothetical protein
MDGEKRLYSRERPASSEEEIAGVKGEIAEKGYRMSEEGDAARAYVEKLPVKKLDEEGLSYRDAVETFAYYFLPKFFREYPKVERKPDLKKIKREMRPQGLRANTDFFNALKSFEKILGASLTDEDINAAWDLANEYLDNQSGRAKEGKEKNNLTI